MATKKSRSFLYMYLCDIKNKNGATTTISIKTNGKEKVAFMPWRQYCILLIKARTSIQAKKLLDSFIGNQEKVNISILPILVDWQILRSMFSKIRSNTKMMHMINAMYFGREQLNVRGLKSELNRVIQQNQKWTRRLKQLEKKVNIYIKKPNQKLKLEILNDMDKLHIRPDGIVT